MFSVLSVLSVLYNQYCIILHPDDCPLRGLGGFHSHFNCHYSCFTLFHLLYYIHTLYLCTSKTEKEH